jgi:hypothetical protein
MGKGDDFVLETSSRAACIIKTNKQFCVGDRKLP